MHPIAFEVQLFEVNTASGGTNTYTVMAGDRWKVLEAIAEEVTFAEAVEAAKKALDKIPY